MGCTQSNSTISSDTTETKFSDTYELMNNRKLGAGAMASVYGCKYKVTGRLYAVKVFQKSEIRENERKHVDNEIQILRMLNNHTSTLRYYGDYQDQIHIYLVLELMEGGNLLDHILKKRRYTEDDARHVCKQMFEAVQYCHFNRIVHRDIKPHNFLLANTQDGAKIKLGDFGLSSLMFREDSLVTKCGTPEFSPPEVFNNDNSKTYGYQRDMWSLGAITFLLLSGTLPFHDRDISKLAKQVRSRNIAFNHNSWRLISSDAKNFISMLLEKNPKERLTMKEALVHPWMTSTGQDTHLPNTVDPLYLFNLKGKLRSAIYSLILVNKFTSLGFQFHMALAGLDP